MIIGFTTIHDDDLREYEHRVTFAWNGPPSDTSRALLIDADTLRALREALAWYADEANYRLRRMVTRDFHTMPPVIESDRGQRAREALTAVAALPPDEPQEDR